MREAYRRSEKRLDTQESFAVAADQRSLVLAGIAIAASAFVASLAQNFPNPFLLYLSAISLAIAAFFGVISANSQSMYTSGSHYCDLSNAIANNNNYIDIIRILGEKNDKYIDRNETNRKCPLAIYKLSIVSFIFGIALLITALIYELIALYR